MKTIGNIRGVVEDAGVSISSGGYPQLVAKLCADEMYDADAKEWAPFEDFFDEGSAEANDRIITAYIILFGGKGATLSCDQVKKITGWEGDSFASLASMDLAGKQIQWCNEENHYDGKVTIQVSWIDEYDAAPGGSVRKLDAKGLAKLDAEFGKFLDKVNKPAAAPSKRGNKNTEAAAPAGETKTEAPAEDKPKRGGRGRGKKTEAVASTEPPAQTEIPAPVESPAAEPPLDKTGPCTKQDAWNDALSLKAADVSVDQLTKVWQVAIAKIVPGKTQAELTGEDWSAVRAAVLDEVSKI